MSNTGRSEHDRILAHYSRVTWLAGRYYRRPWNLALGWRVAREIRRELAVMQSLAEYRNRVTKEDK